MFKNKKFRVWGLVAVALIALLAVGWMFAPARASDAALASEEVIALDVTETIEASGSLEAQPFAALSWKTSGVVESVNVRAGDLVKAGDVLLALQPSSTSSSIVAAQADLINAQEKLDDLLTSGTALAQAEIDLKEAQEEYDDAFYYLRYLNNDVNVPQTMYTAKLVETHNGWKYKYETENFKGPAPEDWIIEAENDLALKTAQLEDAQRKYDSLLAGEDSADVTAARAEVEAAQTTLNALYILAPFDGQALSVEDVVGDLVDVNSVSVYVADMNHLYVEAQVDESDVANVKVGQKAEVTLDALAGVTLTGKVAVIHPVGEEVSGLVKYNVRIDLNKVSDLDFIPLGTTANVTIHIKEAEASLAVPIATIQNDANGEFVMVMHSDGTPKRVDVVSGAIVDEHVVVTGDLQVGDRVLVNTGGGFEAPNPFGGGGE